MTDYEHAGEWSCEGCDEQFEVEHKLDVLAHALGCGSESSSAGQPGGHDGYRRRKQELEQVTA